MQVVWYTINFIVAIILIGYAIVVTGRERSPYLRRKNHELKRTQKTPRNNTGRTGQDRGN